MELSVTVITFMKLTFVRGLRLQTYSWRPTCVQYYLQQRQNAVQHEHKELRRHWGDSLEYAGKDADKVD